MDFRWGIICSMEIMNEMQYRSSGIWVSDERWKMQLANDNNGQTEIWWEMVYLNLVTSEIMVLLSNIVINKYLKQDRHVGFAGIFI